MDGVECSVMPNSRTVSLVSADFGPSDSKMESLLGALLGNSHCKGAENAVVYLILRGGGYQTFLRKE